MYKGVLGSLEYHKGSNQSGICRFLYVPLEGVAYIPNFTDIAASAATEDDDIYPLPFESILLKTGYQWLKGRGIPGTERFTEEPKQSSQGTAFETSFTFVVNRDDLITRGQRFTANDKRQFLVITFDENGVLRLIGGRDRGADFTASQENTRGKNQYECAFTWVRDDDRCFYMVPAQEPPGFIWDLTSLTFPMEDATVYIGIYAGHTAGTFATLQALANSINDGLGDEMQTPLVFADGILYGTPDQDYGDIVISFGGGSQTITISPSEFLGTMPDDETEPDPDPDPDPPGSQTGWKYELGGVTFPRVSTELHLGTVYVSFGDFLNAAAVADAINIYLQYVAVLPTLTLTGTDLEGGLDQNYGDIKLVTSGVDTVIAAVAVP